MSNDMITRENVISAYALLLNREPESEDAITSWTERCEKTDELVQGIIGSKEFRSRSLPCSTRPVTNMQPSCARPEPTLVHWLRSLDEIEGWLSPGAAFMSTALAQMQADAGYVGNIAEIGVYHGKYLTGLATTLRQGEKAIAIDLFEDQCKNADLTGYDEVGSSGIHSLTQQALLDNAKKYCPDANIVVIKRSSLDVRPQDILADGEKVRFFSIDGGHTRDVLLNDLRLAEAVLAPHGIISIDDILNPQWPGIITGTVRFLDGHTKLRPVAFITNKLLCALGPFAEVYKKSLREIAPNSIQRRNVEISNFEADQYLDGPDADLFIESHRHLQHEPTTTT